MKVLVACEESQRVCKAFRDRGHKAYSCDIQQCSGGHPEWHIKGDVLPLLNGNCSFVTEGGEIVTILGKWDLIIAHPPCTYLTNAANRVYSLDKTPADKVVERWQNRARAAIFFMRFVGADCEKICIENPIGFMNNNYQKPTQIIQPYYFASSVEDQENYHIKTTCLWLKGLPPLERTTNLEKPQYEKYWSEYAKKYKSKVWAEYGKATNGNRAKNRSVTFQGIADAMAAQWG